MFFHTLKKNKSKYFFHMKRQLGQLDAADWQIQGRASRSPLPPQPGGGEGGWLALPVWPCPIWTKQPVAHYSVALSPPIFSISGVRALYFLSAGVYPISQDASWTSPYSTFHPPTPLNPPFSFAVMNDHWPSHWQLGSWCHIITVSPFRQNYQITSALKRPGRVTGWPTKETQISKKRRTLKTPWILTDTQVFYFFPGLERLPITAKEFWKSRGSLTVAKIDPKHLVPPSCSVFPFSQVIHAPIYPKIFCQFQPRRQEPRLGKHFGNQTVPASPRWTPDWHRECVLSDEVTFTMWVLTVSSGADVDLVLRLAGTGVATMGELKRANFSSGNKGFHSVWTRNTETRGRGTLNLFELVCGDRVQCVLPGEADL